MATFDDKRLEVQKTFAGRRVYDDVRWVSLAARWLRGDPNLSAADEELLAQIAARYRVDETEDGIQFSQERELSDNDFNIICRFCDRYGYWTNEMVRMPDLDLEYEKVFEEEDVFVV